MRRAAKPEEIWVALGGLPHTKRTSGLLQADAQRARPRRPASPMEAPRPVVFLDVDGVLHPLVVGFKDGRLGEEHLFAPGCMRLLKRIVDETGAELVLSSSWRQFEGPRERLAGALAAHGMGFKRS